MNDSRGVPKEMVLVLTERGIDVPRMKVEEIRLFLLKWMISRMRNLLLNATFKKGHIRTCISPKVSPRS